MEWSFLDTPVPFGFAHRGGDDVAPGNTVAAFDNAVALGFRYLETDVRSTSDGVLVLFHDDALRPAVDVDGRIEELTWAEVAALRIEGEHAIPRLDDVVDRYPEARFNLDPKGDSAVDGLVSFIRDRDLVDRVLIGSFSDRRIRRFRAALGPRLATSPGPVGMAATLARALIGIGRSPHAAVQIPRSQFGLPLANRLLVRRYHALGLQVHVWTINDPAEMAELLDDGVDAIITDRTEALRRVLDGR